jgi:hypothetical protein
VSVAANVHTTFYRELLVLFGVGICAISVIPWDNIRTSDIDFAYCSRSNSERSRITGDSVWPQTICSANGLSSLEQSLR